MNRDEISRIKIKVFLCNILIPFYFLITTAQWIGIFNPGKLKAFDALALPDFNPLIYILFFLVAIITGIIVLRLLNPLFIYLQSQKEYDRARKATLRIPVVIFILHIVAWIVGITMFYSIYNFNTPEQMPYGWSLATNLTSGMAGALCCILAINNILVKVKDELHMTDIKENEYDFFIRFKYELTIFIFIAYASVVLSCMGHYYFLAAKEFPGDEITLLPLIATMVYMGGLSIIIGRLSRQDTLYQQKILRRKLAELVEGSKDVSKRVTLVNFDELGEICVEINRFIDMFSHILTQIKEIGGGLYDASNSLSSSAQEIATTSNQQAASVKEVVATVEESDNLIQRAKNKVDDVVHHAREAHEDVEIGFAIIDSSLEKMEDIRRANSITIEGITSLTGQIDGIWEVVSIINSIASQTKIIAFNAELEASSSGDAGRNFEIVANEIRRLADNTVLSIQEIRKKVNEIQSSMRGLIEKSEMGTKTIQDGWGLSNRLKTVFENINTSSGRSLNDSEEIAHSISQIVSSSQQILLTLKQISEGVSQFAATTKITDGSARQLSGMAESMNTVISKYIEE